MNSPRKNRSLRVGAWLMVVLAFVSVVNACSDDDPSTSLTTATSASTTQVPATTAASTTTQASATTEAPATTAGEAGFLVFFMNVANWNVGVEPYVVGLPRTSTTPDEILASMLSGPTPQERALGYELIMSESSGATVVSISGGIAIVQLLGDCNSLGSTFTIADLIFPTLKQFPEIDYVKILDPDGNTDQPTGPVDSIPGCLEP